MAHAAQDADGAILAPALHNDYPSVAKGASTRGRVARKRIIDATAALLVRDATTFDVVVTTNVYGDILSDLASEISGGRTSCRGAGLICDYLPAPRRQSRVPKSPS